MNKTYTYSNNIFLNSLALIIVVFIFGLLTKGFLPDLASADSLLSKLVGFIILSLVSFVVIISIVYYISNFLAIRKVVTTDEGIQIKNILKSTTIKWEDIKEFGRFKRGSGYSYHWYLYFKTIQSRDNKVILCTHLIRDLDDLIDTVYARVSEAKFVTILNTSRIPFLKRIENVPWTRNDKVFD